MKKLSLAIALLCLGTSASISANECVLEQDSFNDYDDSVKTKSIRNIESEYYVLSYSWSPYHCAKTDQKNKRPGGKDYLQCSSELTFGYILHGLWPQGALDNPHHYPTGYPRACEGDQVKIDRATLEKYLCMTPNIGLLQHEFEYHGTCMHDEALETPKAYFDQALALHSTLTFPNKPMVMSDESLDWFVENNPSLIKEALQYDAYSKEWRICYSNDFEVMACPLK